MELAVARKGRNDANQLAASKRFGKFAPEKEETVRKLGVKEDKVFQELRKIWDLAPLESHVPYNDYYWQVFDALDFLSYSAKDVENFSRALMVFQYEDCFSSKAGLFMSALVNKGNESDYIIHIDSQIRVGMLGFYNKKNLAIKGDCDNGLGCVMERGIVVVEGNGRGFVGHGMKNGIILVKGNVGDSLGFQMKGGTIIVTGDAGNVVGNHIEGGTLYIGGDFGSIGLIGHDVESYYGIEHGKIYHKKKLIVDKW